MDNHALARLEEGLGALGLPLDEGARQRLLAYTEELLRWNRKVNLTAIVEPDEVVDKHLLDSLSAVPEVSEARTLLDLGAGAGLPGIPLAVALPGLSCTLVDAVEKKVAFMKTGAVKAGVAGRVRAMHLRVGGRPKEEGLQPAEAVIARAFMDLAPFLRLAVHYLAPRGQVVAMLGQTPAPAILLEAAQGAGLALASLRELRLPLSGAPRAIATFRRSEEP